MTEVPERSFSPTQEASPPIARSTTGRQPKVKRLIRGQLSPRSLEFYRKWKSSCKKHNRYVQKVKAERRQQKILMKNVSVKLQEKETNGKPIPTAKFKQALVDMILENDGKKPKV